MRRFRHRSIAVSIVLAAALLAVPSSRADRRRKYKPPPPMSKVTVTVLRAADGKPLKNAAVVFHPALGDTTEGNMELKTNDEGVATLSIVPTGSQVLVQVIVPGYRTFGQKYDVPGSEKSITVKLLPPNQQYSIYTKNDPSTDMQNNTPKAQMGHAEPADSPLLQPAPKKKN
ncbi:MAG: carboxypeptidase-like regulatory domain-containing protein [Acidobacteriaceae bacterium]